MHSQLSNLSALPNDLCDERREGGLPHQARGARRRLQPPQNSDFNGLGTKTFASGKVQKGVWKDDEFVRPQEFAVDANGYPIV